jgi:periplasmic protein CpxP/Spy
MKRRLGIIAVLFVCLTFTAYLMASPPAGTGQDAPQQTNPLPGAQSQGPGGPNGPGQHPMPSVDERVQRLTQQLNLSADQQTQVRSILQSQQEQMGELRQQEAGPSPDRRQKMMAIHEATTSKIRALLNDKQQKKYDIIQQKEQRRMQERQGGQGGPPPGN